MSGGEITLEMLQRLFAESMFGAGLPPRVYLFENEMNRIDKEFLKVLGAPIYPPMMAIKTIWTQVRFPRSKKRRIRKKWAKDQKNYGPRALRIKSIYIDKPRLSFKVEGLGGSL